VRSFAPLRMTMVGMIGVLGGKSPYGKPVLY